MEKQGEIVKLINDYNTAGVLEINIKDHWYRTTTRYFRSHKGPRRITAPDRVVKGDVWSPKMVTQEYLGPVYKFNSNEIIR